MCGTLKASIYIIGVLKIPAAYQAMDGEGNLTGLCLLMCDTVTNCCGYKGMNCYCKP